MARVRAKAFPSSSSRDDPAQVLEQNKQVYWIGRGGDEIEALIETPGTLVFCMSRKRGNAGSIGGLQGTQHRVLEQRLADAMDFLAGEKLLQDGADFR